MGHGLVLRLVQMTQIPIASTSTLRALRMHEEAGALTTLTNLFLPALGSETVVRLDPW